MAWAEKLASGRYRGVYRDGNGKRRSAGTYSHKPRAVNEAAAKELEARRRMSADPDAYKRPWGEWADEWFPTRGLAPSTMHKDKSRLEADLRPKWGKVPIGSITRQMVKAWAAELRRQDKAPASVEKCVLLLSASLNAAVDAEVIDTNPASRIKLPKGAQAMERYFAHEEYDAVYKEMPTTFDQLVLEVLVRTGMRMGEAAGLHWNRVDLDRGLVRVIETFDEVTGMVNPYPKSKRARIIPLSTVLVERLKVERDARVEAGENLRGGCTAPHATGVCRSALVLRTETGRPLRWSNWSYRVYHPALDRAKVGHARLYDLRHTYASWLLQRGIPLAQVGQLLGHVSPQTTQIYAHLATEPNPQVLAAIEAAQRGDDVA